MRPQRGDTRPLELDENTPPLDPSEAEALR